MGVRCLSLRCLVHSVRYGRMLMLFANNGATIVFAILLNTVTLLDVAYSESVGELFIKFSDYRLWVGGCYCLVVMADGQGLNLGFRNISALCVFVRARVVFVYVTGHVYIRV